MRLFAIGVFEKVEPLPEMEPSYRVSYADFIGVWKGLLRASAWPLSEPELIPENRKASNPLPA